ncbi:MAG: hypothetical protein IJL97_00755 [Lachnospiraceae bacterium]|nr:hypothetical protein [Lachnospiraceae bacterium]
MWIFGIILIIIGGGMTWYGNSQNSDWAAKIESLVNSGNFNPGDTIKIIGIIVIVVGVVLLLAGLIRGSRRR